MRNLDLETIYKRIKKTIDISSSYSKNIYMKDILKYCRLKPYSLLNNELTSKYKVEQRWIDEFGNSLYIKNSNSHIVFEDVKEKIISSDLFYGLDINHTIEISAHAVLIYDTLSSIKSLHWIYLIGSDKYIRCFKQHPTCERVSPLSAGIDILCNILDVNGIKQPKQLNIVKSGLQAEQEMFSLYSVPIVSEEEKQQLKKRIGI
jgi:hypothetical protein